jgi:hypothetical protein
LNEKYSKVRLSAIEVVARLLLLMMVLAAAVFQES